MFYVTCGTCTKMSVTKSSLHELLERRQTGKIVPSIFDLVSTALYRNSWKNTTCGPAFYTMMCGSVFNIEFSPTDSVAVAACANGSLTTHDPRRSAKVHIVPHAHDEGANCITFLSDYVFVTCSDDTTIKVWDLRKLQSSVAVLKGHRGWVKNIEYDARSGLLFSVAFNDGVRAWSVLQPELHNTRQADNLVLSLNDPVRLRIAPDSSKMLVCLRKNVCLVVDHFDGVALRHVSADIAEFVQQRRAPSGLEKSKTTNRPSLHVLSSIKERVGFRSVMSASFHPSGNFVAMRHIDIRNRAIQQELLSIYDLRNPSSVRIVHDERNYLKYADEFSDEETLDIIKEIHYSPDGKVVASPHHNGVRLLSVDEDCTSADVFFDDRFHSPERALCSPDMDVVHTLSGHKAAVLTCRFAHHDMLLASGCFEGVVHFHQPQL